MEVRCPECTQRLSYGDDLANPLLRCRSCGTTFRPRDLPSQHQPVAMAVAVDETAVAGAGEFPNDDGNASPITIPASKTPDVAAKRGLGTIGLIAMLIALKVGPRIWREFQKERRPNPPVRMRPIEQRDIEKMLRETRKKIDAARLIP